MSINYIQKIAGRKKVSELVLQLIKDLLLIQIKARANFLQVDIISKIIKKKKKAKILIIH